MYKGFQLFMGFLMFGVALPYATGWTIIWGWEPTFPMSPAWEGTSYFLFGGITQIPEPLPLMAEIFPYWAPGQFVD